LILGIADAQAPLILEEVKALRGILPNAKLFVGEAATEAVLKSHGPTSRSCTSQPRLLRQDNPMFSSIRLGDSYLSLYDLYHCKLPAELVVLSGCATGRNAVTPGDELMGWSADCCKPERSRCCSACGTFTMRAHGTS